VKPQESAQAKEAARPKIGIFGLSGCWGEQIVILNCEDQLLDIVGSVEIVDFLGGSSHNDHDVQLTIALVEGSVGTVAEEAALGRIRERSQLLVACGTCACFGGVAAQDPPDALPRRAELARLVYDDPAAAAATSGWDLHPHRPLADYVKVDVAIPGCPMEKSDFVRVVASLLAGDLPLFPSYPVCLECKMAEQDCLLLSRGLPCAGPVTAAGCGARCPGYAVACIGCRGPVEEANHASLRSLFAERKLPEEEIRARLRTFAAPVVDLASTTGAKAAGH
jgi:coenzyme F420-reducing hydrogenase gamma subunit